MFGFNEIRASCTSNSANSTEFIMQNKSDRSFIDGRLDVSVKAEWKQWLNKLALSKSELAVKESKCTVQGIV